MEEGDELGRVVRNKKCYIKILPQNIVPGRYNLYMHLEKNKYTITFFPEKNFLYQKTKQQKKKKKRRFFLF